MIELVTLVLKDCHIAQHRKAMSKTFRDEELTMIIFCQFDSNMLAISRTALTDVYSHIKHCAFDTTDELALSERWSLKMQATHHTIR